MLSVVQGPSEKPGRGFLPGTEPWTLSSEAVRVTGLLSKPPGWYLLQESEPPGQALREPTQPSSGALCSSSCLLQIQNPASMGALNSEMHRVKGHPACSIQIFPPRRACLSEVPGWRPYPTAGGSVPMLLAEMSLVFLQLHRDGSLM